MSLRHWFLALACVVPLAGTALAEAPKKHAKEQVSFGILRATPSERARSQSMDWLKGVGKADATTLKEFNSIWADEDRPVLERVTATLTLGDAQAAKLLNEAKDLAASAPKDVPAILKDGKKSSFYRANLALAYAKALSGRRVYEEALVALRSAKPEEVVDPGAYFFHRAVSEHAMLLKEEASRSIIGVLEDVADAPDRYRMLALLMYVDMSNWRDKDLGSIARKMDNIERRLELARGGPKTQKMQRDVLARLDEIIKELEKQGS